MDVNFQNTCDADFTTEEVEKAMKCLSLDKSSGLIGLTSNFFLLSFLKSTQGFVSPSREENSGNTNSYNYHEAEDIYTYANS